jgi:hypothetical protein
MAEGIMAKLTAAEVRGLREPGKYSDGDGLLLHVISTTRRGWFFRYQRNGKERMMALGGADHITLAEARDRRDDARKLLTQGVDPLEHRRQRKVEAVPKTTFAEAAEQYIAAHEAGWRSAIHRAQWKSTLATYAYPIIGQLAVSEVDTDHVLEVLDPIWRGKPETASRIRGRIEQILSYAAVRGWRDRAALNPALWRGHLQLMLPARSKVQKVEHHAALDWREAPAFMRELHERDSFGARGLQFAILTATRSGEVRGARWDEMDVDDATWTIPAERMKGRRMHRVPLSKSALAVLREVGSSGMAATSCSSASNMAYR